MTMSFKKIHKHPDPLLAGMLYLSRLIPLTMTVRWIVIGDSGSDLFYHRPNSLGLCVK